MSCAAKVIFCNSLVRFLDNLSDFLFQYLAKFKLYYLTFFPLPHFHFSSRDYLLVILLFFVFLFIVFSFQFSDCSPIE